MKKLSTLPRYRAAGIFDDLEVLMMDLAVAMTSTPAHVPDELRTALESRVGRAAYVEITATVAWGNHRARLNRALGVRESRVLRGSILCAARVAQLSQRITVPGRSRVSECG
jgi:alkylhydroperoxidase family enzyme